MNKKNEFNAGHCEGATFGVTVALEEAKARGDVSLDDVRSPFNGKKYLSYREAREYLRLAEIELNIRADVFFLDEAGY